MSGVNMLHVPYRGASPALTDLLGGRAQVMFEGMLSLVGHVREGKLRPLAVTTMARSPVFPDVPTVGEFLPGYEASVWFGIGAPRETPAEIVDKLNKEINAGLADPALKARIGDLGGTPLVLSYRELEQLIAADTDKWGKVIRAADITLETGR
jgi:tripartite-type tricarboxylate transporter receptor subunit TctC